MIGNAEEFNQALGIPYRIVNIVSGKQGLKKTLTLFSVDVKQAVFVELFY